MAFADNHVWAAARQAALERVGWVCERCDHRRLPLEVHHVEPVIDYRPSCAHHQGNLEALCEFHHREQHTFNREVERLLVWADGVVSKQLALPGVT